MLDGGMRPGQLYWNAAIFVLLILTSLCSVAQGRGNSDELSVVGSSPSTADLGLAAARLAALDKALKERDYRTAETLLLEEIRQDPKSKRAARLLTVVGHIFFLDGEYLNSAIAWQKAQAIAPLDNQTKFSLAMAYIRLRQNGWAQRELQELSSVDPTNALYLYWLARIDYDGGEYESAIVKLNRVSSLDPEMMRVYYTLGLCYDYLGRLDEAIQNYQHAIELNRRQRKPSPWPHLDLAVALMSLNRLPEAESQLHEALNYDPTLAEIYYQLGILAERKDQIDEAIRSFERAVELKPSYPEPHYSLGRIYHRLGKNSEAEKQIDTFKELTNAGTARSH